MTNQELFLNGSCVIPFRQHLRCGGTDLKMIPGLLTTLLDRQAWLGWSHGPNDYHQESFRKLIEDDPPLGCGVDPETIRKLLVNEPNLLARFNHAMNGEAKPHGGDRKSEKARENQGSNRTLNRGTIAEYLTARLARDRPDILERMKAGEFPSVRAAAREAGIVRPTSMFYTDNIDDALRAMLRHFSRDQIIQALDIDAGLVRHRRSRNPHG